MQMTLYHYSLARVVTNSRLQVCACDTYALIIHWLPMEYSLFSKQLHWGTNIFTQVTLNILTHIYLAVSLPKIPGVAGLTDWFPVFFHTLPQKTFQP